MADRAAVNRFVAGSSPAIPVWCVKHHLRRKSPEDESPSIKRNLAGGVITSFWEHGVGWSARMSEEHEVTVQFCVFPLALAVGTVT